MSAPARRQRPSPAGGSGSKLEVVTPGRGPRRWMTVIGPIAVASLFAVLLAMAGLQALIVQGQTRLDQLDRELAEASTQRDRLGLRLAELESPDRIVAEARRLGMVEAPLVVYLTPTRPAAERPARSDDDPQRPAPPAVALTPLIELER